MTRRRACWTTVGGRTCDPQFVELVFCLHRFRTLGIPGNQCAKLFYAGIALPEFQICQAFLESGARIFISAGILVHAFVVIVDRGLEVAAALIDLSPIKLCVAGQVRAALYPHSPSTLHPAPILPPPL